MSVPQAVAMVIPWIGAVGGLLTLGAVLHGGCTAYASTARVSEVERRMSSSESAVVRIETKLDTAIELLKAARDPQCRGGGGE